MWETIGGVVALLGMVAAYFIKRNKDKTDTVNYAKEYAQSKSRTNEAAEDRADIQAQKERIEQMKNPKLKPEELPRTIGGYVSVDRKDAFRANEDTIKEIINSKVKTNDSN